MNRKSIVVTMITVLCVVVASTAAAQSDKPDGPEAAVSTAFTYQGQLKQGGSPHTGQCNFQFSLWDTLSGGAQKGSTQTATDVQVTGGLFIVQLNFGDQFQGDARYLQAAVQCAGDGGYTPLSPRTALTPAPYALSLRPGAVIDGDIPYASGSATLKAINASASDGTALFGLSTATSGATAGVFGLSNSPAGAGIWGKNDSFVGVLGESSASNGVAGISSTASGVYGQSSSGAGIYGKSTTGTGVVGESGPWVGVYGVSSSFTGVGGKSTTGAGVAGESTDWIGVYGESTNHDGVHGVSHKPNFSGVAGINAATGGIGVFGSAPLGGIGVFGSATGVGNFAMRANGAASQSLGDSGWIKAMIHVDYRLPPGSQITKCFNSQASGTAVYFPPCGFSVTAVQNGYWDVGFGFNVSGRFIQATVWDPNEGYCFVSDCESRVIELRTLGSGSYGSNGVGVTISYNQSGNQTNGPFTLIVY